MSAPIISKFKFVWKRAFDAAALPNRYSIAAIVLASRLADHCNTRTGQCNPKEVDLAKEMGCSISTVSRARRELRGYGWIKTKRGGSEESLDYTLVIPVSMLTGMNDVTKAACDAVTSAGTAVSYRSKSASIPVTQGDRSNEQGTRTASSSLIAPQTQSAPYGARSARVERGNVTETDDASFLPIDGGPGKIPMYDASERALKRARVVDRLIPKSASLTFSSS